MIVIPKAAAGTSTSLPVAALPNSSASASATASAAPRDGRPYGGQHHAGGGERAEQDPGQRAEVEYAPPAPRAGRYRSPSAGSGPARAPRRAGPRAAATESRTTKSPAASASGSGWASSQAVQTKLKRHRRRGEPGPAAPPRNHEDGEVEQRQIGEQGHRAGIGIADQQGRQEAAVRPITAVGAPWRSDRIRAAAVTASIAAEAVGGADQAVEHVAAIGRGIENGEAGADQGLRDARIVGEPPGRAYSPAPMKQQARGSPRRSS